VNRNFIQNTKISYLFNGLFFTLYIRKIEDFLPQFNYYNFHYSTWCSFPSITSPFPISLYSVPFQCRIKIWTLWCSTGSGWKYFTHYVKFVNPPVDGEEINLRVRSRSVPLFENDRLKPIRIVFMLFWRFKSEFFSVSIILCVTLLCYNSKPYVTSTFIYEFETLFIEARKNYSTNVHGQKQGKNSF
jgi:hypothetical protein